ncbi:MAG: AAA family ATPase [Nanoarchaeota archaeon]|nr:AAA family ATPase [Nanoarchaeota archaeon]
MIIGVTALARAGKDAFADYLVSNYGFSKLNMSDVLADELVRRGMEPTKDNRSLLGDEWRKQYGMDIIIRKTMEKAQTYDKVVITGFRSMEEIAFSRGSSDSFYLVAIVADLNVRFGRRNELDPESIEAFTVRDDRDVKNKGLGKVIDAADQTLTNNYTAHKPFYKEIDALMQKIMH